jgi:thymidylate kinase
MIVLSGGPGGGKSTVLSWIGPWLESLGYKPYIIHETATEVILKEGHPTRRNREAHTAFQRTVLEQQISKEEATFARALTEGHPRAVIICDRGSVDGIAYDEEGVLAILTEKRMVRAHLLQRYTAVLHLKSAACGAEASYTRANNAARFENVTEAVQRDERVLNAWLGHSHLTIIPSCPNVSDKEEHVRQAIRKVLGIPHRTEIERRFVVAAEKLSHLPVYHTTAHIEQRYLKRDGIAIPRIRARSYGGITTYEHATKEFVDAWRTQEHERALAYKEYGTLSQNLYPRSIPLFKTRTYFT